MCVCVWDWVWLSKCMTVSLYVYDYMNVYMCNCTRVKWCVHVYDCLDVSYCANRCCMHVCECVGRVHVNDYKSLSMYVYTTTHVLDFRCVCTQTAPSSPRKTSPHWPRPGQSVVQRGGSIRRLHRQPHRHQPDSHLQTLRHRRWVQRSSGTRKHVLCLPYSVCVCASDKKWKMLTPWANLVLSNVRWLDSDNPSG